MEDATDNRRFSGFERSQEFLELLSALVSVDLTVVPPEDINEREWDIYRRVAHIVRP
jgi:hypothetical protein